MEIRNQKFVVKCSLRAPHNGKIAEIGHFHVVEWTRSAAKCIKMKDSRAKRVKLLFPFVK